MSRTNPVATIQGTPMRSVPFTKFSHQCRAASWNGAPAL